MELAEAIRSLDHADDAHWTADGLPLVAAVEAAFGERLTRQAISDAVPGHTRESARTGSGAAQASSGGVDRGAADAAVVDASREEQLSEKAPVMAPPEPDPEAFTPERMYPDLHEENEGYRTRFPDLARGDYDAQIRSRQEAVRNLRAEIEALQDDYRRRFPQLRELSPDEQNRINQAHLRASRERTLALRARNVEALRRADVDLKRLAEQTSPLSKLDRVMRRRGKDPSLKRKVILPRQG